MLWVKPLFRSRLRAVRKEVEVRTGGPPPYLNLSSAASWTTTASRWATCTRWSAWCPGSTTPWCSSPSPCSSASSSKTRWVSQLGKYTVNIVLMFERPGCPVAAGWWLTGDQSIYSLYSSKSMDSCVKKKIKNLIVKVTIQLLYLSKSKESTSSELYLIIK